ncbi:MAG TPA: uroporphyrinogen-III C-methyltransferase, partial [Candidimonas sp.]|nr:uroporphyrinogen-III C-methyltransferase [Candidimonas sp.]
KKSRPVLVPAFIIVLLIAAALAAALWYQQQQFKQTSAGLAAQVSTGVSTANQAAEQAQQALSQLQEQSRQIASLENALTESREHVESLEQAFRNLTDSGSDLVLLNDVDHLLTIAQQQLQLSGNVANAVISLETAQAQLARANRPGLASLLQTINGDLDRLRAASTVDIAALSTQLDELSALVSEAPLLVPDDAAPAIVESAPTPSPVPAIAASNNSSNDGTAPWWRQALDTADDWSRSAWSSISQDLGQFITVRRVDDPTALLMSPDQATRFRENLRLRIMTAQLALMMRQPKVWQAETEALVKAVESRYDQKSQQARQALKLARHMADTSIELKLPTVTNSLQAVEALREASAKSAQDGAANSTASDATQEASEAGSDSSPQTDEVPQLEPAAPPSEQPADAASVPPQG